MVAVGHHQQRAALPGFLAQLVLRQVVGLDDVAQDAAELLELACAAAAVVDRLEGPLCGALARCAASQAIDETANAWVYQEVVGMNGQSVRVLADYFLIDPGIGRFVY